MNKKKKRKYQLFFISIFIFVLAYNFLNNKYEKFGHWLDDNIWYRFDAAKRIILYEKNYAYSFYNSYNQKYLPETLFLDLDYETRKLDFLKQESKFIYMHTFFIEIIEDNKVLVTDIHGNISLISDLLEKKEIESKDIKSIENNLTVHRTLDTFLFKDRIYISYIDLKDSCKTFKIAYAKFNTQYLDFKNFYNNESCKTSIQGGRMQSFIFRNKDGLIFTLSSYVFNNLTDEPQDENSFFGKILFQDFKLNKPIIFSKGHKVNQGLVVIDDLILSTEHGPKGGDEVNKIEFSENYGWPISSYGVDYGKNKKKPFFKVSHSKLGFKEPIYSFITAIGISEIIKLPNNFSDFWQDNFIITSLNRGSIYRIKFDENFEKLLFAEEIFIGKRIRDIKYMSKQKKIILALENRGELGILSTND
tara:strand:- start:221 stop:1474 length:1254 start_codon:yes stop_codon:yes gene_type:complete